MNLSFCFFFFRNVSLNLVVGKRCIILQCWVAKLDEHGKKLTNSRKDKLIAVVLAS